MHFKLLFKLLFTSFIIAVCAISAYLLVGIMNFPDKLHIMEGSQNDIISVFPFEAAVDQDYLAVSGNNDKKVQENIFIDKNENITTNKSVQLSLFGMPVKKVALETVPEVQVVPCGMTVGVKIYTDGVMVLGTGSVSGIDGNLYRPTENILRSGDLILGVNGQSIQGKNDLIKSIEQCDGKEIELKVNRGNEIIETTVMPVKSSEDNTNKIGVWVRDSTQGIGTLTYYNPKSKTFGALGHGIMDVDTKKLMSVKTGTILESDIVSIKKGKKGAPGELVGEMKQSNIIGNIKLNTTHGLYGFINTGAKKLPDKPVAIAMQTEVHEGPAKILSNVNGSETKQFDVYIESVNKFSSDDSKGMVIKITDKELLTKTNGIVQGMSGSPILQDGKLIGAITHVFVQNPTKGYGIFIENMLKQEDGMM